MIFRDPKVAILGGLEHSARHPRAFHDILKQACCVKSFSKIFQDKPPKASLLERKPRSLQERIPRRARAGLRGVGGGATPLASWIESAVPRDGVLKFTSNLMNTDL